MTEPHAIVARARATLADLTVTRRLAQVLAHSIAPGMRIYLRGELGAGKTALIRELLHALGHTGRVASPSFSLMEPYNLSKFEIHHFDFYRLSEPDAWRDAGFEDSFTGTTVVLVEWPEHAGRGLPRPDLVLHLAIMGEPAARKVTRPMPGGETLALQGTDLVEDAARSLRLDAHSQAGAACLNALHAAGCCDRELSQA